MSSPDEPKLPFMFSVVNYTIKNASCQEKRPAEKTAGL